jgi:hypothetical protein
MAGSVTPLGNFLTIIWPNFDLIILFGFQKLCVFSGYLQCYVRNNIK